MTRQRDTRIPDDERLFRRLRATWLDGDQVLQDAVDMAGTSCDRERYRRVEDVVSEEWPFAAAITPAELPSGLDPDGHGKWEFFAYDDPLNDNDAHAEIRIRRESRRPSTDNDPKIRRKPGELRLALKSALARRLRLVARFERTG